MSDTSDVLYNSRVLETPVHLPLRRLDRNARTSDLMTPDERRLPTRHLVYRFYDTEQLPIYAGVTGVGAIRWDAHRKRSSWWPLAEYVAVSAYPSYEAMREAERATIRSECPRFNKQAIGGPANVKIPLHGAARDAAALIHREAMPEFIAELAALLARPDLFPQPEPPPCGPRTT